MLSKMRGMYRSTGPPGADSRRASDRDAFRSRRPSPCAPFGRRASSSWATRARDIPVARNVWQHVEGRRVWRRRQALDHLDIVVEPRGVRAPDGPNFSADWVRLSARRLIMASVNGRRKLMNSRHLSVWSAPAPIFVDLAEGGREMAVGAVGNRVLGGFQAPCGRALCVHGERRRPRPRRWPPALRSGSVESGLRRGVRARLCPNRTLRLVVQSETAPRAPTPWTSPSAREPVVSAAAPSPSARRVTAAMPTARASCAVALIDRLTHHVEILVVEGRSYRRREAELTQQQRKRRRRTDPAHDDDPPPRRRQRGPSTSVEK